jgi:hypothetical protein
MKQQAVWWYDFIFAGKRIRGSAKTTRKAIAIEAEKNLRLELERSLAGIPAEKPQNRIRTVAEVLGDYRKAYPRSTCSKTFRRNGSWGIWRSG